MKKILFILPNLSTGGTLSSISGLLNYIDTKSQFDILPLTGTSSSIKLINKNLIEPNNFINYYYSREINNSNIKLLKFIIVKSIKKLSNKIGINCEKIMFKLYAKKFNNKYDIVVAFEEGPATILGSYIKSSLKFAWVHCDYSRHHNSGKEYDFYKKYQKIVCVSQYTSNVFKSIYPALSEKVTSINNIMDYSQIKEKSKEKINDKLFKKSTFTIISVGRFTNVKRFADIPQIAKQIKDKGLTIKWYILGPITKEDYFLEFQKNIKKYNVEDIVVHIGNKKNPYPYFRESNLLVCLSSSEACPMIFNEAKVIGLPIITTNFPSSFEFITPAQDGEIINFENLSQVISHFIEDNNYYHRIKNNILNNIYTNDLIYRKLDKLFEL